MNFLEQSGDGTIAVDKLIFYTKLLDFLRNFIFLSGPHFLLYFNLVFMAIASILTVLY
ncbi:TPA: hypothetical protein U1X33_000106 [Streptococcus suis]|nr:hypothetical protein [Streptococcus suis]